MSGYPPYAPYTSEVPPPSLPETIHTGHKIRVQYKSRIRPPTHAAPRPAQPKGPKVTDVMLSPRAMRLHQRCLRKHNTVMTDRLARLARPARRYIIAKWRENADKLPPQAINRYRNFLDAHEPFQPDQAYQFFINLKKGKGTKAKVKTTKKGFGAMCVDKRYTWARKATVALARGIQQRLEKPGSFTLENESLRLSDIVLTELCCYMRMHVPSRRTRCSKSKFFIEMADKVAVWIVEILTESEDRMLMMDFDEDDEVLETMGEEEKAKPLLSPTSSKTSEQSKKSDKKKTTDDKKDADVEKDDDAKTDADVKTEVDVKKEADEKKEASEKSSDPGK